MRPWLTLLVAALAACVPTQFSTSDPPSPSQTAPDGPTLYAQRCAGCHQGQGEGIEGIFPPLARHVPALLRAEGGREYLAWVLLMGLQGPIQVQGKAYNGRMPGFGGLKDSQLAALLNHLSQSWGNAALLPPNFSPYTPAQMASLRQNTPGISQMLAQRNRLAPQP